MASIDELESRARTTLERFTSDADAVEQDRNEQKVEDLRVRFLGRKSETTELLAIIGQLSKEDKPKAGQIINQLKGKIEGRVQALTEQSQNWLLEALLSQAAIDPSLPTKALRHSGSLHPVTLMQNILVRAFNRMGFSVYDGPEIELDFYNFAALNFPDHHPARDMQDTFHVESSTSMVLRTHTSGVQIHAMLKESPPLKIIVPGRVFRCDSDLTHTPMFHQLEALVVDERIRMSDMKGSIDVLLKSIFGENLKTRLRPSFFPFVEPGAEVDLQCHICAGSGCRVCKQSGWIEVGGCGMVHPNVFEMAGIDSEQYTGFAFGFGIDRLAMLKFGLQDLRQLFESEYDFLQQFPTYS